MSEVESLLRSVAPEFGATLSNGAGAVDATIEISLPSGKTRSFALLLTIHDYYVFVQEQKASPQLPQCCPDRHINPGGTFCLGWKDDSPSEVRDEAAARRWWSAVVRFLSRQINASYRRKWAGQEYDRAHGDAAVHQAAAEAAAEKLGPNFSGRARRGDFTVRLDEHLRGPRIELWGDGRRLARITKRGGSLVGGHTYCPCDPSGKIEISRCQDHAEHLESYISSYYRWCISEEKFMQDLANHGIPCCGTLDSCGLKDAHFRLNQLAKPAAKPYARRSKFYQPPKPSKRPRRAR